MTLTAIITTIKTAWELWKQSKPAAKAWIKERKTDELENAEHVHGVDVPVVIMPNCGPCSGVEGGARGGDSTTTGSHP